MQRWKLWGRRSLAVIAFVIAFAAALGAAAFVPYFLAAWSASILLLTVTSILCFGLVEGLGAFLCSLIWGASSRRRFASLATVTLTLLFAITLYIVVLRPLPHTVPDALPSANTHYWQLSTGSRIAYSKFDPPDGVAAKPEPIIFLHGGPGMFQGDFDQDFYGGFAAQGFRVYLYDQAGSGFSDFLPRISEYTEERAVEDLEAIRQKLSAEKLILIGCSWGAELAVGYMAKYPEHVAKVVFHSPGPISWFDNTPQDFSRSDVSDKENPFSVWLNAAFLLAHRNLDAAQNLMSQREAEEASVHLMAPAWGSTVCKGDSSKLPASLKAAAAEKINLHFNIEVLVAFNNERSPGDPRQQLRGNSTPAILLYGECNSEIWSEVSDYRKTFSNLKVFYIPHAGHLIHFEQPELMRSIVVAFLLDQPDAIHPYASDDDPRPVQH